MNILIVYATYSSGTHEASQFLKETLDGKGHVVTIKEASVTNPEDLEPYELVILASPSWEVEKKDGQPHIHMGELIQRFQGKTYEGKKFAVLGLGDIHYAKFCGAVDHLEAFVKNVNGTLATKSLRINRYPFDEEKNNELIKNWLATLS